MTICLLIELSCALFALQNVSRVDNDVEMKAYGVGEDDVIAIA